MLILRRGAVSGSLTVSDYTFALPGIVLSGGTISIGVDAAAVTVKAIGVSLAFGGHTLTGDFLFDQRAGVTRIAVANLSVAVTVGGNGATLSEGEGAFIVTSTGIAGQASGKIDVQAGPIAAGGRALLRINTTGTVIDETILLGTRSIAIRFAAGEENQFEVAVSGLTLNIGDFISIEGDATRRATTLANGTAAQIFAGTGLAIFMGLGPAKLANGELNPLAVGALITNARIGLIQIGSTYAVVATGTASIVGINGVTLTGTVTVRFNNTGLALNELLTIPGSTDPGVEVKFDDAALVRSFEAKGGAADRARPGHQRRLQLHARRQRRHDADRGQREGRPRPRAHHRRRRHDPDDLRRADRASDRHAGLRPARLRASAAAWASRSTPAPATSASTARA